MTNLSCSAKKHIRIKAEGYIISSNENLKSRLWAKQAFIDLKKRSKQENIVMLWGGKEPEGFKNIEFEINSELEHDYCIEHDDESLKIKIKNQEDKDWMLNQLIEAIGQEDDRFDNSDLDPATIKFDSKCIAFDFSYRDPHYSSNLVPGNSILFGNNNVDLDWGIWGHNLTKVMQDVKDSSIFALVDSVRNKKQFSFTSPVLFDQLKRYILNDFGDGTEKSYNFMIMPQDNNLVCSCSDCIAVGNTKNNATPAVSDFIQKISNEFPKHQFFTSAYITTRQPPAEKLNENTGVFLSTINIKKGIDLNLNQANTRKFVDELETWSDITSNIYIWDYSANFDDYLTPIPVLYSLQKQLQFYKSKGVTGVFLNASGYDYSSFDDLKTYVAGELLKNTDTKIDELCVAFFKKNYPDNHELLTDYYLSLERAFEAKKKTYSMYGGIDDILSSYLNSNDFMAFYKDLEIAIKKSKGKEKEKLEKLFVALSFTRLQIAYNAVTGKNGCATLEGENLIINSKLKSTVKELKRHDNYTDLTKYKEANGNLDLYIKFWKDLLAEKSFKNLLLKDSIHLHLENGEGIKYLNDGLPGNDQDYHQGWFIDNTDSKIQIFSEKINGLKRISLRFLNNKKHGFYPPEKIEIWGDHKLIHSAVTEEYDKELNAIEFIIPIDFTNIDNIEIIFTRKAVKKSMIGCDEIRILN